MNLDREFRKRGKQKSPRFTVAYEILLDWMKPQLLTWENLFLLALPLFVLVLLWLSLWGML